MLTHKCTTSAAGGAAQRLMKYGTFEIGKEVYIAYVFFFNFFSQFDFAEDEAS